MNDLDLNENAQQYFKPLIDIWLTIQDFFISTSNSWNELSPDRRLAIAFGVLLVVACILACIYRNLLVASERRITGLNNYIKDIQYQQELIRKDNQPFAAPESIHIRDLVTDIIDAMKIQHNDAIDKIVTAHKGTTQEMSKSLDSIIDLCMDMNARHSDTVQQAFSSIEAVYNDEEE